MTSGRGDSSVRCFFASDLHGKAERYDKLAKAVSAERPHAVFLGGDLLPHALAGGSVRDSLAPRFAALKRRMGRTYPRVFLILGNDDPRCEEPSARAGECKGLWLYMHARKTLWRGFPVYGYSCIPPTPFLLKDWERYDVSRFVDPGCVPPEEGRRTVEAPSGTIQEELSQLTNGADLGRSIFLFHAPPYGTALDRAALDGKSVDHAPLDVHVGSIAIRRFIEARRPWLTLHGHVHESARLTGSWRERLGGTVALSAAHDGPELALVRFDPADPSSATRELI